MNSGTRQYRRTGEFPEECFVQEVIDGYFSEKGFQRIETHCVDYVCEHRETGERWHIEANGSSAAIGLDFRLSLGQLLRGITHQNTRYALALPDLPQFRNQIKNIEPWVCRVLNLHWIIVDQEGGVTILEP
jgi:hypothetical protein